MNKQLNCKSLMNLFRIICYAKHLLAIIEICGTPKNHQGLVAALWKAC